LRFGEAPEAIRQPFFTALGKTQHCLLHSFFVTGFNR